MRDWNFGIALVLLCLCLACGGSPDAGKEASDPQPVAQEGTVIPDEPPATESTPSDVGSAEISESKAGPDQAGMGLDQQQKPATVAPMASPKPEAKLKPEKPEAPSQHREVALQEESRAAEPIVKIEPEAVSEPVPPAAQGDPGQATSPADDIAVWETAVPTQPERVIVPSPPRRTTSEAPEEDLPPQVEPEEETVETVYELPVGTQISVRLTNPLSTEWVAAGERFQTTLEESVYLGEQLVLPHGTLIEGRALRMVEPEKGGERASLTIDLVNVFLKDENLALITNPITVDAPNAKTEGLKEVGGAAAVGTILGAIFGGKKGAAIGASVGAGAATVKVLSNKGPHAEIGSEALFTFRLEAPLRVAGT